MDMSMVVLQEDRYRNIGKHVLINDIAFLAFKPRLYDNINRDKLLEESVTATVKEPSELDESEQVQDSWQS